jgi:ATP-dependent RNA helicase DHX36
MSMSSSSKRRNRGRGGGGGGGRGYTTDGHSKKKINNGPKKTQDGNVKRNLKVFENVDEIFRINEKKKLEDFRDGIFQEEQIIYSNTLTNHERRYVHALAGQLGLVSKSYGKGSTRYLTVRLTKKQVNPEITKPDTLTFTEDCIQQLHNFESEYPNARTIAQKARAEPGGGIVIIKPDKHKRSGNNNYGASNSNCQHTPLDPEKSPLYKQRLNLPAWEFRKRVVACLRRQPVLIVFGETGCGKSTQIPQFIMDSIPEGENCNIIVTQPRRISAIGLADRVSSERGCSVGNEVGYTVRLENKRSAKTELLFCTTGVMLRMIAGDPLLSDVTHVVIDEVHERDRNSDFLLIILRRLLKKRKDLKLILMSATMQAKLFQEYFEKTGVETLGIAGRTFPVQQYFLEDVLTRTRFYGKVKLENHKNDQHSIVLPEQLESMTKEESSNVVNEDELSFSLQDESADEMDASIAAAMAAISAWTPGSELTTNTTATTNGGEVKDNGDELAAAMMAIAEGRMKDGLSGNVHDGRPIDEVMAEYLNGTEEDGVDTQLILKLLEHICNPSSNNDTTSSILNTTFERDGNTCLGGILVFLPGWGDISGLLDMMVIHPIFSNTSKYKILPLHGGIASSAQRQVFKRVSPNCRKIVLATNIAETSITIDDIVVVIDSGKYKSKEYDPFTQMSSLQTVWVPKSSAKQRAGRAGRVRPGVCFTLMSKSRHNSCMDFATPELLRTPLEELCLQIKLLIHDEIEESINENGETKTNSSSNNESTTNLNPLQKLSINEFLDLAPEAPSKMAVRNAILSLKRIGALDKDERLTRLGLQLARIPMEPRFGRTLILSIVFGCLDPILSICCALGYRMSVYFYFAFVMY